MRITGELPGLIGQRSGLQLVPLPLFVVAQHGEEELALWIPQQGLQPLFDFRRFLLKTSGRRALPSQFGNAGNGHGVCPEIGIG